MDQHSQHPEPDESLTRLEIEYTELRRKLSDLALRGLPRPSADVERRRELEAILFGPSRRHRGDFAGAE